MLPVRPTHDSVFVDIVDREVTQKQLGNGKVLHLLGDDTFGLHDPTSGTQHSGIRPRWARVLAVGPETHGDVALGDLVLCDYGKWSRGIPLGRDGLELVRFWRIRVGDILLVNADSAGDEYLRDFEQKLFRMDIKIGHL